MTSSTGEAPGFYGPLFTRPRSREIRLWAFLAALNLGIGVLLALQPERLSDVAIVMGSAADWLRGLDVYAEPGLLAVYPPHAIVLLSPLALLPFTVTAGCWIVANVFPAQWDPKLGIHVT